MQPIPLNIKPWCNCHATGKFLRQDGYSLDGPSGLWVHGRCRKPSKMNYERNVLGLTQIPQPKIDDIYEFERKLELKKWANEIIKKELCLEEDDEDDEDDD